MRKIFLFVGLFVTLSSSALTFEADQSFECKIDRVQFYFGDRDRFTFLYYDDLKSEASSVDEAVAKVVSAAHDKFVKVQAKNSDADAWSVGWVPCRKKLILKDEKDMNPLFSPFMAIPHNPTLDRERDDVPRKGCKC